MEHRVSNEQLEELLQFLTDHPTLVKGVGVGARSKENVDKQWNYLAKKLNSHGSGSTKSGERWRKYWADIKHKTKQRLVNLRRDALRTGDVPSLLSEDLSEIDKKILAIIGEKAVFGDTQHIVPLQIISTGPVISPKILKTVSLKEAMKIGFIGGGKLAYALASGFISAGLAKADEITASCHPSDLMSAEAFKKLGATALFENKPVVERSEVVIVSVKPDVVVPALQDVKELPASRNKLFISVAMGVSTGTIEKALPPEARVIRVMPNTPALVREGAAALSRGSRATSDDAALAAQLFRAVGTCDEVPEYQMDAVTALSGSGPAYVYMLIESLADGGVRCGLPRDLALRLATQTTLGAAAMLRNGGHPAAMKDNVTSPGGSTAEGTYHLEKNGFRSAVIGAVTAATERCKVVNKLYQ